MHHSREWCSTLRKANPSRRGDWQRSASQDSIHEMAQLTYADFDHSSVLTMQLANQSAWKLNHDYVDAEHILIGLCRNSRSNALAILTHYSVTAEQIIAELKCRVRRGPNPVDCGKRPAQPNAKRVTQHAIQVASSLDATFVSTRHLLLGMLFVDGSIAFDSLSAVGLNYDDVMRYITC